MMTMTREGEIWKPHSRDNRILLRRVGDKIEALQSFEFQEHGIYSGGFGEAFYFDAIFECENWMMVDLKWVINEESVKSMMVFRRVTR